MVRDPQGIEAHVLSDAGELHNIGPTSGGARELTFLHGDSHSDLERTVRVPTTAPARTRWTARPWTTPFSWSRDWGPCQWCRHRRFPGTGIAHRVDHVDQSDHYIRLGEVHLVSAILNEDHPATGHQVRHLVLQLRPQAKIRFNRPALRAAGGGKWAFRHSRSSAGCRADRPGARPAAGPLSPRG